MLGYLSANEQNTPSTYFSYLNYLLGNYTVTLHSYQSGIWLKIGVGKSTIECSDKLISEELEIAKGNELITMNNTFASNTNDAYKLLNLNHNTGTIDIYNGKFQDNKLIFCSSNIDAISKSEDIPYLFKIIFSQVSEIENQVVIGRSRDEGKTWIPFVKTLYKRK